MRKGQTEIMGLLVVVVLFVFIAMFFLLFSGGDDSNPTDIARASSQVNNFLNSFLEYTPCYDTVPYPKMKDIIKDCFSDTSRIFCGQECKPYIESMFLESSEAYNPKVEYQFQVHDPADVANPFIIKGSCSGNTRFSGTSVVSAGRVQLEAKLLLCQNIE